MKRKTRFGLVKYGLCSVLGVLAVTGGMAIGAATNQTSTSIGFQYGGVNCGCLGGLESVFECLNCCRQGAIAGSYPADELDNCRVFCGQASFKCQPDCASDPTLNGAERLLCRGLRIFF